MFGTGVVQPLRAVRSLTTRQPSTVFTHGQINQRHRLARLRSRSMPDRTTSHRPLRGMGTEAADKRPHRSVT